MPQSPGDRSFRCRRWFRRWHPPLVALCVSCVVVAVFATGGAEAAYGADAQGCTGDCSEDGAVTADELVRGVNLVLGNGELDECLSFDTDRSASVTVDELVAALTAALQGCSRPGFEPDDLPALAVEIGCDEVQTRSLIPAGDVDWMRLNLDAPASIGIETSGARGDTTLWLYDAELHALEYDDDSGLGDFSRIDRECGIDALVPGTYLIRVESFAGIEEIDDYQTRVICHSCNQPNFTRTPTPTHSPTLTPHDGTATPTVPANDEYEYDDAPYHAKPISCGEVQHHTLNSYDDTDWVTLTLESATSVLIEGRSPQIGATVSPSLFDDAGSLLQFGFSGRIQTTCESQLAAGTYLIRTQGFPAPASYNLSVLCVPCSLPSGTATPVVDEFEPDDSRDQATVLGCNQGQQHSFVSESGIDADWIRFSVDQLSSVRLMIASQSNARITLFGASGDPLHPQGFDELTRTCDFDALPAGDYWAEITPLGPEGFYELTLSCAACSRPNPTYTPTPGATATPTPIRIDALEPDDSPASANVLKCDTLLNRSIAPDGDIDNHVVVIGTDTSIRVGAEASFGTFPSLTLTAADGQVVSTGFNSIETSCGRSALTPGVYTLGVQARSGRSTFDYTLSFACETCSEPNPTSTPSRTPFSSPTETPTRIASPDAFEPDDEPENAKVIECGESQVRSLFREFDTDWFSLSLQERMTVALDFSVADSRFTAELFDDSDTFLESRDVTRSSGRMTRDCGIDPLGPGTYRLRVSKRFFVFNHPFDYRVTVSCLPCDLPEPPATVTPTPLPLDAFEPDDTIADAKSIPCNQTQERTISDPQDIDWVAFTVDASRAIGISLLSFGENLPDFALRTEDGSLIQQASGSSFISRGCDESNLPVGKYLLSLGATNRRSTTYRLRVGCALLCASPTASPTATVTPEVIPDAPEA